ncbi:hypothetical protein SAMN05518672_104401 [Chitinophaga sp. CF118]|uniref:hypothetical protein n=1 Tax=Chitinophaga sp. CF118 TaxID=1884367 RepID=UPI0008F04416|nr:hypothetical protein [Chitinophaga sp. CF118]SFE07936.1 hypothetical protein SAMN05518672_104401 [Chitinophaga sp. CF118]
MKTTLFIIAASLFSGIVSAQETTVKAKQSATTGSKSVNSSTSVQADVKSGNVKNAKEKSVEAAGKAKAEGTAQYQKANGEVTSEVKGAKQAADHSGKTSVSTSSSSAVSTTIADKNNAGASSESKTTISTRKAEAVKSDVSSTTSATVKGVHSTTTATGNEIKQTTTKASPSIKANSAVKTNIKPHPVKVASNLKTNVKVGIK